MGRGGDTGGAEFSAKDKNSRCQVSGESFWELALLWTVKWSFGSWVKKKKKKKSEEKGKKKKKKKAENLDFFVREKNKGEAIGSP